MRKMLFASLLAVAMLGFADVQDAPKPEVKGGAPAREMKGRGGRGPGQGRPLMADVQEVYAKLLAKYDKDQDGKLSEEEQKAIDADYNVEELQAKMQIARAWRMFKILDKDKDGKLSEEELAGMRDLRPPRREGGDRPPHKKGEKKGGKIKKQGAAE